MKRLSADSRIEQVLKRITSASSRAAASSYPSEASIPRIRSESCTFIWQPKVVTWNFLGMDGRLTRGGGAPGARVRGLVREGRVGLFVRLTGRIASSRSEKER